MSSLNIKVTCPKCKSEMNLKKIAKTYNHNGYSITIDGIDAYVCNECGNTAITPDSMRVIQGTIKGFTDTNREKPDLLNINETADLLRVSTQTLYNMIRQGRLKAYKIGREWRFIKKDIIGLTTEEYPPLIAAKGGTLDVDDMNKIRKDMEIG